MSFFVSFQVFILKSILSEKSIAIPAFFHFYFHGKLFSIPSLSVWKHTFLWEFSSPPGPQGNKGAGLKNPGGFKKDLRNFSCFYSVYIALGYLVHSWGLLIMAGVADSAPNSKEGANTLAKWSLPWSKDEQSNALPLATLPLVFDFQGTKLLYAQKNLQSVENILHIPGSLGGHRQKKNNNISETFGVPYCKLSNF